MKFLLFIFITVTALDTTYGQSIEELLTPKTTMLDTAKSAAALQQLANDFERIALAHPKNWHANYYTAYTYTLLALAAEKDRIDALADRAKEYLDVATAIRPDDAETDRKSVV